MNDELTTNRAAFIAGEDIVEGAGSAELVSGSIARDTSSGGVTFKIKSSGTDSGYVLTIDSVPAGAALNFTTTAMVEDPSVYHYETQNVLVEVDATEGVPVSIGGQYWEAALGDGISYNGNTYTVNNTHTVDMTWQAVTPTNVTVIKNPRLDTSLITISTSVKADINTMLVQNGFTQPLEGSPWVCVPVVSTTGGAPSTQDVANAINTSVFASNAHGIFNAMRMADMYSAGGTYYAVLSYSCKESTTCDAAYDEETGKIYVKTAANYGSDVSDGYIYRVYDLSECTDVETNSSGFVTKAKVPNKYAVGSATYRRGNPYDTISFAARTSATYWAYAAGEKLLNNDGSVATRLEKQSVAVSPTLVVKTVNIPITSDSYTPTGTSSGFEVGTYVYTIDQSSVNAYTDENGAIRYRITFDGDETQAISKKYLAQEAIITAKPPVYANESYIQYVTLKYPGESEVREDADTAAIPISVYERPIRQQVKISKDIQTLPESLSVWYCANDGVQNDDAASTCAGCGRSRTVEETKTIDYAHDTYTAFFNEDLSETKQEKNWITRLKEWLLTITGIGDADDSASAVANFRFKSYLKSNLERLYRDEDGQVVWLDRNGNELMPNYIDEDGDGKYESFTWTGYAGESAFPVVDKVSSGGAISSLNVQKIYTKVEHEQTSAITSARANNVWNTYTDPDHSANHGDRSERNSYFYDNDRAGQGINTDDAIKTNMSLYSYEGDCINVAKSDAIEEEQNKEYTRILEMTEAIVEDGAGETITTFTYNYEKFFDAIAAANTDKWDSGDISACTFNYEAYSSGIGAISMQAYPGQNWEDTKAPENQKGDEDTSFDLFGWIHEKVYGSVDDYREYEGGLSGINIETNTATSKYAKANAQASNAVRQFAVKWYLADEVAKRVVNNGVGDGEDVARPNSMGGAYGVGDDNSIPYDDYIHDYALYYAIIKAYNYLRPFYENDLDTIYALPWDSAANGGNDKDTTTLSVDLHEEGAFYNTSAYLPYGIYVIVEQTPTNFSKDTGYDLINRAFNIEKPKEVLVPSLYEDGDSGDTSDNYDTHYTFDITKTPAQLAASKADGGKAGYLIRFNEEWPDKDFLASSNLESGTCEYVIRSHSNDGDFEVYKYGIDADKSGSFGNHPAIKNADESSYEIVGISITQSEFDPLKDYYGVAHNGEEKDGVMIEITEQEGASGTQKDRYKSIDKEINNIQTANGSEKYDTEALAKRFYYASISEDNGKAPLVMFKGGETDDNNASGMYFKRYVPSVTGELTAHEGKYAPMLVAWTITAPAAVDAYSSEDFCGYADIKERNTFKAAMLTIRKVDAETGEQLVHDDSVFGIYAASRYSTDEEIAADAAKLTDEAERVKFVNQFKPGDTKFYMEDTKVYASKEFLEAMGAYDISYVLTLSKNKAKRYGGHGYVRLSEGEIKELLGAKGYTKITGTVRYGVYTYDTIYGTSIPDDETITWYYSVYNTDSPLCVGTIPKGTPICSEKNAVILEDDMGSRTGMMKAYSTLNDVLMEDEDSAGTTSYHLQNTGYIRTPQPLGSGCYVLAELKTPYGYLRGKPEAHEIYSGTDYYYEGGDMFKKVAMVDYAKRIDKAYSY